MWKAKVLGGGETDLNKAIEDIDMVESSGVRLLPEYADVFRNDNKKNNEIIFHSTLKGMKLGICI